MSAAPLSPVSPSPPAPMQRDVTSSSDEGPEDVDGYSARNTFYQAAAELEKLTHEMCYLFGRATKAVSICPPAYYADIVCTRYRAYLSEIFDNVISGGSISSGMTGGVGASAASGSSGGTAQRLLAAADAFRVHPNMADSMFYI